MARRKISEARKLEYAQAMRDHPTEAEAVLGRAMWRAGMRPRRQVIVCGYIVDFCFPRQRVIIEVDGYYHFTTKGRASDKIRTSVLTRSGYTVIRYANARVIRDAASCAKAIQARVLAHAS